MHATSTTPDTPAILATSATLATRATSTTPDTPAILATSATLATRATSATPTTLAIPATPTTPGGKGGEGGDLAQNSVHNYFIVRLSNFYPLVVKNQTHLFTVLTFCLRFLTTRD